MTVFCNFAALIFLGFTPIHNLFGISVVAVLTSAYLQSRNVFYTLLDRPEFGIEYRYSLFSV